jgi:hypothetical protein
MEQKEIDEQLKQIWSYVDYKVGDWVETCQMLPGIVQSINISYDHEKKYFIDDVIVFYPHYAFNEKYQGQYKGGSHCSVCHCGVHKITPEYACKLMALGEERLKKLWEKMQDESNEVSIPCWEDYVEKEYADVFSKD